MAVRDIDKVMDLLEEEYQRLPAPIVTVVAQTTGDPFKVLISCILSLRTKDQTTADATKRLFTLAQTPESMRKLAVKEIEKAIYPVGFYKTKARTIHNICERLVTEFNSIVPNDFDLLLTFGGVGRKTANLVLSEGYKNPFGLCIDTHCHRFPNRMGWIRTKTPEETEMRLRSQLPPKYWGVFNTYVVAYGQNICRPTSPLCSQCKLKSFCKQVGVKTWR